MSLPGAPSGALAACFSGAAAAARRAGPCRGYALQHIAPALASCRPRPRPRLRRERH